MLPQDLQIFESLFYHLTIPHNFIFLNCNTSLKFSINGFIFYKFHIKTCCIGVAMKPLCGCAGHMSQPAG